MTVPFVTRAPLASEVERLRLALSTFQDGSGQERGEDGKTRPGWRDIERVVAELLEGRGLENKDVFDVIVSDGGTSYGLSIKSKELSRASAIGDLATNGRVYMELCNSPAKLWTPLKLNGISEADFGKEVRAAEIGASLLSVVESWKTAFAERFRALNPRQHFDLANSVYLVASYNKPRYHAARQYQVHAFSLAFPKDIEWRFSTAKCLRGYDPAAKNEVLFDWYGLSGGQLKYYPRATTARFCSEPFELLNPKIVSISHKANKYWPTAWKQAQGKSNFSATAIAEELDSLADLSDAPALRDALTHAAKIIRGAKT